MLKHTLRWNKKKLNHGCYQQVVPPEGWVRKNNSWFEDWTPPLTEAVVQSILLKRCAEKFHSSQENSCAGVSFEQSCRAEAFIFVKRRLQRMCFAVNFATLLKTLIESEWLLDWWIHAKLLNDDHISCWMPTKFTRMLYFFLCILVRFWL